MRGIWFFASDFLCFFILFGIYINLDNGIMTKALESTIKIDSRLFGEKLESLSIPRVIEFFVCIHLYKRAAMQMMRTVASVERQEHALVYYSEFS